MKDVGIDVQVLAATKRAGAVAEHVGTAHSQNIKAAIGSIKRHKGGTIVADGNDQRELPKLVRWGLLLIAGVSIIFALLHALYPQGFDEKTVLFLIVAVVALMMPQITKFKGFGIEFETKVNDLETAVGNLEKEVGRGSKSAIAPIATAAVTPTTRSRGPQTSELDPNDPNKGQFGGAPEANGRRMTAKIEPDGSQNSSRCRVKIRIEPIDARPLTGPVRLHLHPTFGQWASYELDVKGGVAEDKIVSYGAFTIGAEADGGKTRLELDLVDVPGGTKRFYEQ